MRISYDPDKQRRNLSVHGVSFIRALEFDWSRALIRRDERRDYGEPRYLALGYIEGRLHALVFTPRAEAVHVISLRKANLREVQCHEEAIRSRPL